MSHTARNGELEKRSARLRFGLSHATLLEKRLARAAALALGGPRMTLLHGRVEHGSILSIEDASKDPNGAEPRGGCRMRQVGIV
jgi:hypothetical protein